MNSINISGRLGRDPELKTSQSGVEYTNFSVAVDRMKTKDNKDPGSDWFYCTAFGKTAVFVTTYIKKGTWVLVSGRMQDDVYPSKEDPNKKIHSWTLIVERVESPLPKKDDAAPSATPSYNTVPAPAPTQDTMTPIDDDDIPF